MNPKRRPDAKIKVPPHGDGYNDPSAIENLQNSDPPPSNNDAAEISVARPVRLKQSKPPGALFQRFESVPPLDLESEWGNSKAKMRTTEWTCFTLGFLLIFGGIVWWIYPANTKDPPPKVTDEVVHSLIVDEPLGDSAKILIDRITQSVQNYADATTIDQLLNVSRHPERVRPLMVDHYARHPFVALGPVRILGTQMLTLGDQTGLWMWMVTLELQNSEKVNLIVETKHGEVARIDWETAVIYQPREWDEFLETRPRGSRLDFRVNVTPDDLFSHEFEDRHEWDCYRLTAPESREHAFGYVKSDSPTAQLMRSWFKQYPGKPARMILCLAIPQGLSSPRGVVIDHAKSARWIYVVPPTPQ